VALAVVVLVAGGVICLTTMQMAWEHLLNYGRIQVLKEALS